MGVPFKISFLYAIVFLASFLLFQIELIIAKILLPQFGGGYSIWGACLVFFQCALLAGYIYAHSVIRLWGISKYRCFHLLLIFLPLLTFPGRPLAPFKLFGHWPMVVDIFLLLLTSIGLVFFVLSTISLVVQSWLAASTLPQRTNPYRLYAISNVGSFCALLSYPFFFEYHYGLAEQLFFWRTAYGVFLVLFIFAFLLVQASEVPRAPVPFFLPLTQEFRWDKGFWVKMEWFLLSCASTILFLSVTNIITAEIVPCPLIWIFPLSIYLLSFVLTFRDKPGFSTGLSGQKHIILGLSAILFFLTKMQALPVSIGVMAYFILLFLLCVVGQHELYKRRPLKEEEMTYFYVIISLGGFLGGIFVAWVAPKIFTWPLEYLIGLCVMALGMGPDLGKTGRGWHHARLIFYFIVILWLGPRLFHIYGFWSVVICLGASCLILWALRSSLWAVSILMFICFGAALFAPNNWSSGGEIASFRDYYGMRTLKIGPGCLFLYNGTTVHGCQFMDPRIEDIPTTYYYSGSPVGKVLSSRQFSFRRIGVIGLGAGTLAAYGQKGQTMDFYELDPEIIQAARMYFSFLKDSKAQIRCIEGDARVNLSKSREVYDLLIIDAFTGDSIPVHLLTTEAILEYKKHLAKGGGILFHISNNYIDLSSVILDNAMFLGAHALLDTDMRKQNGVFASSIWASMTWDARTRDILFYRLGWGEMKYKDASHLSRRWTDQYSCILTKLNLKRFLGFM